MNKYEQNLKDFGIKDVYTALELSTILDCQNTLIARRCERGDIKATRLGRTYAITLDEVKRVIANREKVVARLKRVKQESNLKTIHGSLYPQDYKVLEDVATNKGVTKSKIVSSIMHLWANQGTLKDFSKVNNLFDDVREWAKARNIDKAEPSKQMLKVCEELGETAGAMARGDRDNLIDSLGDLLVTIIILAQQNDLKLEDCLESAYREIANRKGKTVNGVFVKESDLRGK